MTSNNVNNIIIFTAFFRMQRHGFSVLGSDATNRRAMSSITELGISGSSANREEWTEFQIAPSGDKARTIEREGPTGLIVTTTLPKIHAEIETRILSIEVPDTTDHTRNILLALADEDRPEPDFDAWRAFQDWLSQQDNRVTIPYSKALAERVACFHVRLRRDFSTILSLIQTHAILHQATRDRRPDGKIVATINDYIAVRDLVADLIAEGIDASVSPATREVVEAVAVISPSMAAVTYQQIATHLSLDKSAARRRCLVALEAGYLRNHNEIKGKAAEIVVGDPLPAECNILPKPEDLMAVMGEGGTVAAVAEGVPPTDEEAFEKVKI